MAPDTTTLSNNFRWFVICIVSFKKGRPKRKRMDGVKDCLCDKGLTFPEAKECVKDRREWRRIVGGDVDDPGWSRLYETVKAVDVLIYFALGINSPEG